jgi:hypothetical protein
LGVVPTEFAVLVDRLTEPPLGNGPAIPEIDAYVRSELERLEDSESTTSAAEPRIEPLNDLFQRTLDQAWSARVDGTKKIVEGPSAPCEVVLWQSDLGGAHRLLGASSQ